MAAEREQLTIPPSAIGEWRALADALSERGPAPCEGGILPLDAWHATGEGEIDLARVACGLCPVRPECGAYALAAPERLGVWGGLTAAERAR